MDKVLKFFSERKSDISKMYSDKKFLLSIKWIKESIKINIIIILWMGRPIIKYTAIWLLFRKFFES